MKPCWKSSLQLSIGYIYILQRWYQKQQKTTSQSRFGGSIFLPPSYWCANIHSHGAKWDNNNCFHWWSMNPNGDALQKGDTCRCHGEPRCLCTCDYICLFARGTTDGGSLAVMRWGCMCGRDSWSMIRWIVIHSFIHVFIQWISCLLRDSKLNALASFIITLCIICKEEINCFHLIQIGKRGTHESNITAQSKHDHGETSGFASVTSINGEMQF